MIRLDEVHKSFTVKDRKTRKPKRIDAVRGITLQVKPGEIYGLLGPNGAGKSTTLRMIASLMDPDAGRIEVCGLDTREKPEAVRACLGYLSTDMNVYGRFTPRELLRIFGEFQSVDPVVAERRGLHLLEKLDLADFADVKMEGFSSGQKQKVSIARALLHDPKVVIFDEPTTGLDVLTAKTVLDLLRIMRDEGRTVIVSTHVMPMVEEICDRVGIIFDGKLHGDAPPRDLLRSRNARSLDEVFFQLAAETEGGN
ncbi:ABC transporter ATP-binding protein [Geothrix rubra]|uniref:ABC transporter ATP-binding protein n=1 Tax=Geothrix rubra TaxID=2927977 RepID=A0ABQ5Q2V4_9BACT|nr:ABC transporter ATP-binding protein [Geothrix rubra]GLH68651.1 ABC transporter ATP-binding protein [Geothrix rubra]